MGAGNLPPTMQTRFNELGRRIRWQQFLQGLSRIILVLLGAAVVAVAADVALQLSGPARGLLLVGWLMLGAISIYRLYRTNRTPDPAALAAAIEVEFPRLAERLSTAVGLADAHDPAHGSPFLVNLVVRDADVRTGKLDLNRAAPRRATLLCLAACGVAILAVVVPLVAVPSASVHARRFLAPWHTPVIDQTFALRVTSGDPTVKRGESTTLSAVFEPLKPDAALPTAAIALIRSGDRTERVPMVVDAEKRELYLTRGPVDADFDYQIVSEPAASEWHKVSVLDPVRLENARVTITPPAYARKAGDEPAVSEGLGELFAVQHSTIALALQFNRAPTAAWIEWKPENAEAARVQPAGRFAVPLDGETSTVTLPAKANGLYRLHAEVAKLKTPFRPMPLRVVVDMPPRFERVGGVTSQPRPVHPDERAKVEALLADDFGLTEAALEVRVNDRPVLNQPLEMQPQAEGRVVVSHLLDLGKLKLNEGDRVSYRLAATDNRSVPEAKLTPQKSYFPVDGAWAELKAQRDAAPLKQQEIAAQKEEIDGRLRQAIDALNRQQKTLRAVRIDSANRDVLRLDETDRLEEVRGRVLEAGEHLDDLARDAGTIPDLSTLADAVREATERDVRPAASTLRQAQRDTKAGPRGQNLALADKGLQDAVRRLETLREANRQLAKLRLEKQKIDDLADEQKTLANETRDATPEQLAELRRRQQELEDRLRKLQQDSEPLRNAINALRQQRMVKQADRAGAIENDVRGLNNAMRDLDGKDREGKVAALLKLQQELQEKAAKLASRSDAAARAALLDPLKGDEIQKAMDALKSGDLNDAVDQQERAAFELDRLADELEKAVARSRDPRETAQQLSRLQEHLRQQLTDAVKDTPFDLVPKDRRESLARQQEALQKAVERLSVPPDLAEAKAQRRAAADTAGEGAGFLSRIDAANANDRMAKARDALSKLAEALPTREKRLAAARTELTKLRQEQEALAQLVEQTAKLLEKQDPDAAATQQDLSRKLTASAARQKEAADRLAKLDLPGHEERQARTGTALKRAKDDLDAGRPQDVGASQQAARRELERLEQAVVGQTPVDEQVDRLAKRQRELADRLQKNAAQPDARRTKELQRLQGEIANDLQKLQTPEAPASRDDALTLSREAEKAATAAEAARQASDAADALQRLADRVNGRDEEAEQVDRLAKKQKAAAEEADRLAKKKEPNADLRRRTQKLADEARNLRPGDDGQKDKQRAIDAFNRAQQAMTPEQLAKAQADAAESLQRLADKMQARAAAQPKKAEPAAEKPEGLPTADLADEARRLAREQRMVRDELARANEAAAKEPPPSEKNPLQDLIKEEEKIAEDARKLVAHAERGEVAQSEEAREAANRTLERLRNGETAPARDAGRETADRLEKIARGSNARVQQEQAAELARRQTEVNRNLDALVGDKGASRSQQAERQKQLRDQAAEFKKELQQMTQSQAEKSPANEKLEQAAGHAGQSEEAMKQAIEQNGKNQADMSRASQDRAADAMQKARQALRDAASAMDQKESAAGRQAGRSVEEAREQMERADKQLGQGNKGDAGQSMQNAADQLRKAAEQVGRSNNPLAPGGRDSKGNDGQGATPADLRSIANFSDKYPGKAWGELPGEVRNQIISDLKARYGEDFAKYIKLYFEQLAERK